MTAPMVRDSSPSRIPTLGVGLLYNPSLPDFVRSSADSFDYVEVIPDMFWTDTGSRDGDRYVELEGWVKVLDRLHEARCPIVAHNIGLSLASADDCDPQYVANIGSWCRRYQTPWHSDHLSFSRVSGPDAHQHDAGIAVPVPYDQELLELVAQRIERVQNVVHKPFLIENNVYFITFSDQDLTEVEFLNALADRTGCFFLLDLHNLYANARNHSFDAFEWVDGLDLSRVAEIHIAGGSEVAGMYADSHSGPCPEPVWRLLEHVLPRTPNVGGVTFEFHDSYYPLLKEEGVRAELTKARAIWARCR